MINQSKAIKTIFLTEFWERFSYYGINAILILYIIKTFGLAESQSYIIYGTYGALIYSSSIIGGFLVDKLLGTFKSIIIGAILIGSGHFILLIPESTHRLFFLGLSLIITGTGLFKPSIATMIGELYKENDIRREQGFTLAYIGSNIGTIISPIVCTYIALNYNWSFAFGVSGFGMFVGLFNFLKSYRLFPTKSFHANKLLMGNPWGSFFTTTMIIVSLIYAAFQVLQHSNVAGDAIEVIGTFSFVITLFIISKSNSIERRSSMKLLLLTIFYIIFMVLLQQTGSIMNVFTLQHVRRDVFGYTIPTGMFQSVEPFFLVFLGLVWKQINVRKKDVSKISGSSQKFSYALIIMGIAFSIVALPALLSTSQIMNMLWINLSYGVMGFAELFIGPVGLAMVSTLAPKKFTGYFMGIWILSSAFANFFASKVGMLATHGLIKGEVLSMHGYGVVFSYLSLLGFASGLILFFLGPVAKARF